MTDIVRMKLPDQDDESASGVPRKSFEGYWSDRGYVLVGEQQEVPEPPEPEEPEPEME